MCEPQNLSILLYIVLSNPERKKHYDKYGTVADDEEGEEAFYREFEEMFFGKSSGGKKGGAFDEFDDFMEFLETDTKFMRKMFRDMGKNVRIGPGKRGGGGSRKKGTASGGMGIGGDDMDDLLNFFMMPGMAMGMGMPGMMGKKKTSNTKKQKK